MKKTLLFFSAYTAILFTAACNKEQNNILNPDNGPVFITAIIDSETKATLAEADGAFAFSNGDAIKVCNESGAYSGTTTSTENTGTFVMADGFNGSTDGIAGFPASIVTGMTSSSVTFTLPTSYEYSAVGGADPNTSKVPCPMIGSYVSSTKKVSLKQAGSVIRFRVTNIVEGTLSFSFETKVTGEVTLSKIPSETTDGILASSFPKIYGYTITINNVPTVTTGNYVYITIPVPTGTVPNNIIVTNEPSDASDSRFQSLVAVSTPSALTRAGGYKWSVAPEEIPTPSFTINAGGDKVILAPGNLMARIGSYTAGDYIATADKWKFGGYFEIIGSATDTGNYLFADLDEACVGKWVDLFSWQGTSTNPSYRAHGLVTNFFKNKLGGDPNYLAYPIDDAKAHFGDNKTESLYSGCWETDVNNAETPTNGGIYIENGGDYTWRTLTKAEWNYILVERTTSTLNGVENARLARATVAGVNGILIFPDNVGSIWDTESMGTYPSDINQDRITRGVSVAYTYGTDTYTSSNMIAMAAQGIVFLPCAGYRTRGGEGSGKAIVTNTDQYGYYWTGTASYDADEEVGKEYRYVNAWYINFNKTEVSPISPYMRFIGRSVRLARDI